MFLEWIVQFFIFPFSYLVVFLIFLVSFQYFLMMDNLMNIYFYLLLYAYYIDVHLSFVLREMTK